MNFKVVLLDLDECLGSFGIASAFFYMIHKQRNMKRHPFSYNEMKYISTKLVKECLRPGMLTFLKKLYRNRDVVDVILFTNHMNESFLPFLQNCLNYVITGKLRVSQNPVRFFKDWFTREDPRRKTTPKKNIMEILQVVYPSISPDSISVIMYDDTPSKIIYDTRYHTVVEVPEYNREITYSMCSKVWNHIMGKDSFPTKSELVSLDEEFMYVRTQSVSQQTIQEDIQIAYEFFDEPLLLFLTETLSESDVSQTQTLSDAVYTLN